MILTEINVSITSNNLKHKILHESQFLSMWLKNGGNRIVFTLSLQIF